MIEDFLKLENQKAVLSAVNKHFWGTCDTLELPDTCVLCSRKSSDVLILCVNVLSNILMNNYSKSRNDRLKYSASLTARVAKF